MFVSLWNKYIYIVYYITTLQKSPCNNFLVLSHGYARREWVKVFLSKPFFEQFQFGKSTRRKRNVIALQTHNTKKIFSEHYYVYQSLVSHNETAVLAFCQWAFEIETILIHKSMSASTFSRFHCFSFQCLKKQTLYSRYFWKKTNHLEYPTKQPTQVKIVTATNIINWYVETSRFQTTAKRNTVIIFRCILVENLVKKLKKSKAWLCEIDLCLALLNTCTSCFSYLIL